LGAINGLANNNALRAINVNQFRGGALQIRNTVSANNNAIATPLPVSTQSTSQRREGQLLRPSQLEPGEIYRGPDLRLNDQEWFRMNETTDRLSALAGPSTLQSLIDTITKGVVHKFSSFLPKKNKGN
ncbi:8523_t:CDS:2, partial [Racocetra fulgida]